MGDAAMGSCVDFGGPDLSSQTLVVKNGCQEVYCLISKTSAIEEAVKCKSNASATLLSTSHLSVRTQEEPNTLFCLEYGRDNKPGMIASSYSTVCPIPSNGPGTMTTDESVPVYVWIILAIALLVFTFVVCCSIYRCYKEKAKRKRIRLPHNKADETKENLDALLNNNP